ncbi:helix-turn-helix transcriptional regulator [Flavobacterium sp. '19STA2R22 D10 B1']|uniref:helix-turn-helix transcriptional regulator n=1 Tax=Flavobacterium aerium TaxID=3037261 RepID=UPI00278C5093|nr:hypothetical protein [Flavobacterium sp. '19STA2R22 D10 B1']
MKIKQHFTEILHSGVADAKNDIQSEFIKLINIYIITIVINAIIFSIWDIFRECKILTIGSFIFADCMFLALFSKKKLLKIFHVLFFITCSLIIFFFGSFCGVNSGVEFLYIPLIFAIPFLFDLTDDYKEVLLIFGLILLECYVNHVTDYTLFYEPKCSESHQIKTLFLTKLSVICGVIINIYLIYRKELLLSKYYKKYIYSEERLKTLSQAKNITSNQFKELTALAETNHSSFIYKFNTLFPLFVDKLNTNYPLLIQTEIELCSYIKLRYTTKEIARFTNSSIRSIEAKKYRVRKKMNLDKTEDLYTKIVNL